jgi:acyl carrier protein
MDDTSVRTTIRTCLRKYLDSTERTTVDFGTDSNLVEDLGLSSDEGVDFVLDLCSALGVDLPHDFNPFIDDSGGRGRRVSEMVSRVEQLVAITGVMG